MTDWDPDYEVYFEDLMYENDFDPYEEGYTGRPVTESDTLEGITHHMQCSWLKGDTSESCSCKELFEADYVARVERDAEDLHEEWWM